MGRVKKDVFSGVQGEGGAGGVAGGADAERAHGESTGV